MYAGLNLLFVKRNNDKCMIIYNDHRKENKKEAKKKINKLL